MRSMVEGASAIEMATLVPPLPPRWRAVPLPRCAGQENTYHNGSFG